MKHKAISKVVYTETVERAIELAANSENGHAIVAGPGTLNFHGLIARHGAGEFETLFCPVYLRSSWVPPKGCEATIDGQS